jgi:hypothetical protein
MGEMPQMSKHQRNTVSRAGALLLLSASLAAAFPAAGTLDVVGPSDFVGLFTISGASVPTVSGYGGGYKGIVDQTYTQMLFCDDFSDDVSIPANNVAVNISTLTNGSDLSDTRFGDNTSWRGVQTVDPSLGNTAAETIDNATALQRYQMVAYLIWNYEFFGQAPPASNVVYGDATDTGIQSAIWAIMDPTGDAYNAPLGAQDGDINTWLTNAATWLSNPNADRSFLTRFEIISDAQIGLSTSGGLNIGIQELLTVVPVPEPASYGLLALASLGLVWRQRRRRSC